MCDFMFIFSSLCLHSCQLTVRNDKSLLILHLYCHACTDCSKYNSVLASCSLPHHLPDLFTRVVNDIASCFSFCLLTKSCDPASPHAVHKSSAQLSAELSCSNGCQCSAFTCSHHRYRSNQSNLRQAGGDQTING